jgi:ABC-type molybdate transport system substrate-binding protein
VLGAALCAVPATSFGQSAASPFRDALYPPWQHGANNDSVERGLDFTVPEIDNLPDFHGNPIDPKLVLYVGGNYFFAMAPLVKAFEARQPDYKGRIYWETLPPGLLVKQMEAGGTITVGNMTWTVKPDAYFAGLQAVQHLVDQGRLSGPAVPYVTNRLAIMIPKGNPAHIKDLADLGRANVRLAMPNPAFEGVGEQIKASLRKAGGDALVGTIYEAKVKDGSAILTRVHHRQTPLFLMQGRADAGVTWRSEAVFQEQAGNAIDHVDIPTAQNTMAVYAGGVVKGAAHQAAARQWLAFLTSAEGLRIFERYGFKAYR